MSTVHTPRAPGSEFIFAEIRNPSRELREELHRRSLSRIVFGGGQLDFSARRTIGPGKLNSRILVKA